MDALALRTAVPDTPPDSPRGPLPPPPQTPAMAGPTVVATIDQIRDLRQGVQPPRAQHNTALKFLRDRHENPPGRPTVPRVDITRDDPLDIGVLQRGRGMAYTFVENQSQPWSWRPMLASLPNDVLQQVVGEGVLTITCEPGLNSYDHRRHHEARMREGPA